MLRTNLSTRPFYNERAVHLLIAIAALLVVALTAWNVLSIVTLSRENTELSTRVNRDHAEAEQLTKMAADIRRRINQKELQQVVNAAREANSLIDQRTFSWTAFFNRIESTMPPDVMLTSVRPSVKNGITTVTMVVLGRRAEDVDEFIEKLEATGGFEEIVPSQQDRTEQGLYRVTVESVYTGEEAPAEEETPNAPAAQPEAPSANPPAPAPRTTGGAP
ncbi:MAG TPA: PilN domain-containing protein [Vicinamibacterales bacterium]|nr:PilN domain-containing protein [Vicinamibacterales bacterium]